MEAPENASRPARGAGLLVLSLLLNAILLGWIGYVTFGAPLQAGDGVSMVLINDTLAPMLELKVEYPGGAIPIGRLEPGRQVGSPLPVAGEFEAVVSFKDEAGNAYRETLDVKPLGDLLLLFHVLPVLEEMTLSTQDGSEVKALKASTNRVRVLLACKGEDTNI